MKTENMSQTQTQTIITKSGKILDPQQMHVCRLCDKLLSSSSSLDRHMLTHSGERPFVCKRCHMTFTTNGNMHRHMRTHLHKDSLARQQQEQMQLKQSLLVGGNGAATATGHLHPDHHNNHNNNHHHRDQIADSSGHSQIASASSASTPLPGGFYSTATSSQQQQQQQQHQLSQHLAQQQQLQHQHQPALMGPLASLIAANVSAATTQQNHHQNPVTALLNQQLLAAALNQQQNQQHPLAASQRISSKDSPIINSNNNNQEVSTTFQHQQQADISASAAQLLQSHHQAFVANQMMQTHQAPLEHRQLMMSAALAAATGRQHGANQASLESVKTVMLAAAAAAAAAANQNQNNNGPTDDYSGSSTDLLMEVPNLDHANVGIDLAQVSPGTTSNRLRAKRRKQINPLKSSHRPEESTSTNESEPQRFGSRSPDSVSPASGLSQASADNRTGSTSSTAILNRGCDEEEDDEDECRSDHQHSDDNDEVDDDDDNNEPIKGDVATTTNGDRLLMTTKIEQSSNEEDYNNNNQSAATSTTSGQHVDAATPDRENETKRRATRASDELDLGSDDGYDDYDGQYDDNFEERRTEGDEEDDEIVEDISQSYVKTANPNATRKGGKRNRHCYKCKLCTYSSVDRCTLVRHLRIHSGERPYICGICRYAFTTKANCERHVRKRHKKQYNSLGGSGGVKGSNGGGRSLIITDHSNHQTIPVKVNPVAAQTISQTLLRIQEKEQQLQQQQQQQQQQPGSDNVVRPDSHDMARENDNIERINERGLCTTTNTMNINRCSNGTAGKRKHRTADNHERSLTADNEIPAYQRRRLANKLHKSATTADQGPSLPAGFGLTGSMMAKDLFKSCEINPMANVSNLAKQPNDFFLDPAAIQAANSFMGAAAVAAAATAPSANNDADLTGNNQTSELFVNLLSQIQQMTNNNQRDVTNNNNSLAAQLNNFSAQQQQSSVAPSPAPIDGEHNMATSVSDATLLANMLAAGKAMSSDSTNQQIHQQPAALTEQLNSLLSSKHLSQQLRNLNLQNPFFNRRNPFNPFNSLDFAQALDLSCKLQTHK